MKKIQLSHGGGGEEMNSLINDLIFKIFENPILSAANDAAILPNLGANLAFTTDSFVVSPRRFNGGNIGKIAVCGTVNDLLMVASEPKFISCALIIEEGFDFDELREILESMKAEADKAGVKIACGDTKVVPNGKCDGIFINTSGIGEIFGNSRMQNLRAGQKIILSGDIGRHGSVIMALRDELSLESDLKSDCKSLCDEIFALKKAGICPKAMRDATRGGLSAVLNEWANASGNEIHIFEEKIAILPAVQGLCELLGFEPYELANEGTFIAAVDEKDAQNAVEILSKFNPNAQIIGEICATQRHPAVILESRYGTKRFLEQPKGELLPRIC